MAGRRTDILDAAFFSGDVLQCAHDLIGTELVWGRCGGIVVESEAYLTENDEASHCFSRPTTRAYVARNGPGAAYIYLNYGVHWMLNVLVKGGACDGLILIRAVQPMRGLALMRSRRGVQDVRQLCSGPGKLTQSFDINQRHHEMDLTSDRQHCFVARPDITVDVLADERIGITRSMHLPWRFTQRGSHFISRPVKMRAPRPAID